MPAGHCSLAFPFPPGRGSLRSLPACVRQAPQGPPWSPGDHPSITLLQQDSASPADMPPDTPGARPRRASSPSRPLTSPAARTPRQDMLSGQLAPCLGRITQPRRPVVSPGRPAGSPAARRLVWPLSPVAQVARLPRPVPGRPKRTPQSDASPSGLVRRPAHLAWPFTRLVWLLVQPVWPFTRLVWLLVQPVWPFTRLVWLLVQPMWSFTPLARLLADLVSSSRRLPVPFGRPLRVRCATQGSLADCRPSGRAPHAVGDEGAVGIAAGPSARRTGTTRLTCRDPPAVPGPLDSRARTTPPHVPGPPRPPYRAPVLGTKGVGGPAAPGVRGPTAPGVRAPTAPARAGRGSGRRTPLAAAC